MKRQLLHLSFFAFAFFAGCGKNEPAPAAPPPQTQSAPSSDGYLGTITKAQKQAVGKLDTVSIDAAINRFQVDEGRNPKDLNELVAKKYLAELPKAPVGKKFEYDANTGTVKLVAQ